MITSTIWNLVPLLLGMIAAQPGVVGQSVSRLVIEDEVIIRVPVQAHPIFPHIDWVEHKGPKCVPAGQIERALLSGPQQVDFVFANHSRVRAELDQDCPALDFYNGFYLHPSDDRICAHRDAVHSRIGGSCMIERFSQLVPHLRR